MDIWHITKFIAENVFQVAIQFAIGYIFKTALHLYKNHRRKKFVSK